MGREKMTHSILFWTLVLIAFASAFCVWQNNAIVVSNYCYEGNDVPDGFDGFRIVQISDLHNKMFGQGQKNLLAKVESLKPDIIVVTGDLTDRRKFNLETAMSFVEGAVELAPVYYVSGNHEAWSGKYSDIIHVLGGVGVVLMDNHAVDVEKENESVRIIGSPNPDLLPGSMDKEGKLEKLDMGLKKLNKSEGMTILLAHHPELFSIYAENEMDLTFVGHAHGGQFRIPFLGGIFAPDQGLFPEYDSGIYAEGESTMIVSRGLGNSIFPLRINNPPEIVQVTLKCAK